MDGKKKHWEGIYETRAEDKLSWSQPSPLPSLEWILELSPDRRSAVIDVGGGVSKLVDGLLDHGFERPAVLDISGKALERAKARLGDKARLVDWIEADIAKFHSSRHFAIWHDRAVFHFLIQRLDRQSYVESMKFALPSGSHAIVATFSPAGPGQCSGLTVMRFDERSLAAELGQDFKLIRSERKLHSTPWGASQEFIFCIFRRH